MDWTTQRKKIKLNHEYEKMVIGEIHGTYGWMLENSQDSVIMDIGGHVGCFAVYCGVYGYKKLYCYEPTPCNFELLKENTKHLKDIELINRALSIEETNTEIDFYLPTSGKNMGICSSYVKRGRNEISVNTINFKDELERIQPDIIKMDCEGAEYDLLLNTELPECVKKITIEIHLGNKKFKTIQAPALIEKFKNWDVIKEPKITGKNWTAIAQYIRK
tara:strand:+ start:465 stop:1118 length:654 start_codon:yes stop_codon:yes gene_type:complete